MAYAVGSVSRLGFSEESIINTSIQKLYELTQKISEFFWRSSQEVFSWFLDRTATIFLQDRGVVQKESSVQNPPEEQGGELIGPQFLGPEIQGEEEGQFLGPEIQGEEERQFLGPEIRGGEEERQFLGPEIQGGEEGLFLDPEIRGGEEGRQFLGPEIQDGEERLVEKSVNQFEEEELDHLFIGGAIKGRIILS